ncbi:MAG TPA: ABC transporter permease [Blastocatellia bacterium]|nr:ABC transporter permease [Blastocatellia bacterium]
MADSTRPTRFRCWLWLIHAAGVIVPRRLRADWRQEWEAELRYWEELLAEWEKLGWRNKFDLLWRSLGAFRDALLLQPRRLEDEMFQDLRYGARMLLKHKSFTLIAAITLGLGIGATTAIYSVVDAVLLRPLPYPEAARLMLLREVNDKGVAMAMAEANFEDVEARSRSFAALAYASNSFPLAVTGASEAARARVAVVSGGFFDVMGVRPWAGRGFLPEEEKYGGPVAVVVSHGYWRRMLGGRADFGAVKLNIDGAACNVVGVMPPGFDYPEGCELWMTRNTDPPNLSRAAHIWPVMGRLREGVTLEQARVEVSAIGKQLRRTHGEKMDAVDFTLLPLQQFLTRNVREGLWLLLGAVGLLLLVACANVSNLLLAQYTARWREFTIRTALGAGRLRMARQLVFENLLLTLPSAALGALLAKAGAGLLPLLEQGHLPRVNVVAVNGRVLIFASALAVLIAVALGLLPALQFKRRNLQAGLKEAGRGQSAGTSSRHLRGALIVTQLALTMVLLVGAGLLGRSFIKLWRTDPGFDTTKTMAMTLALPSTVSVAEDERLRQFYVQLLERLRQLPGVEAVGGVNVLPLSGRNREEPFLVNADPERRGLANYRVASSGYFAAMGIPLRRGRIFDGRDTVNAPHVAVISQSLAARYWPNEDPLGRTLHFGRIGGDERPLQIIGVVGDAHNVDLESGATPTVYAYSLQRPQWWQVVNLSIIVRTPLTQERLIPAMRAAVQSLRPDVPLQFRALDQVFSASLDQRRFSLTLYGVFAVAGLLIAAAGLYGTLSYAVTQRTQEIGLRLALGAQGPDVLRLVIGQGMRLALSGLTLGLMAAIAATRLLKSMLHGVSATDPLALGGIALLLLLVALMACYLPARRATKVDPMIALRHE